MNKDTIYRQDAIDAVAEGLKYTFVEYRDVAEKMLKDVPSAQPEIIRCKDCKHRIVNEHAGEKGYFNLKAMCELDSGDPFELGRCAEDDEWFCADAEKRTE